MASIIRMPPFFNVSSLFAVSFHDSLVYVSILNDQVMGDVKIGTSENLKDQVQIQNTERKSGIRRINSNTT